MESLESLDSQPPLDSLKYLESLESLEFQEPSESEFQVVQLGRPLPANIQIFSSPKMTFGLTLWELLSGKSCQALADTPWASATAATAAHTANDGTLGRIMRRRVLREWKYL